MTNHPRPQERIVREGESFLSFKRNSDTARFPEEFARYVRSKGDVYFWPQGGFHVVTDIRLAKEVLTTPSYSADRSSFFISRMPNLDLAVIKDFFGVVSQMMVMSDGEVHQRRRTAASHGVNEKLLSLCRIKIETAVERLLEPLADRGRIDFVSGIARELPQTVLADLFGIPDSDRPFFNKCSTIMTGFFGGAVEYTNAIGEEVNSAAIAIRDYFKEAIAQRRRSPQDDFFTGMLQYQKMYGLGDDEIISQAVMMLVAGQVTTTDQICNNMFLMLDTENVYEKLQQNPALLQTALEEFKRIDPAVTFLFRVAKEKMNLGPQPIEPGDTIFISTHAVNRDPTEFENPDQMILDRKGIKHFAYGHGSHYCMGARLGRMQMNLLFGRMIQKFPKLVLDSNESSLRDHYSLSFSGFKTMPVQVATP